MLFDIGVSGSNIRDSEILKNTIETYRKLRNTIRWMLGTLHHFHRSDTVAFAEMPELERLMLHQLSQQSEIVRRAYVDFDYKTVISSLATFMNSELSAFYFDIRKDALYCDPPSSVTRKAALTTIDLICEAILKWLAPVLSFTCDEAWRMYRPDAEPSVHLTLFPDTMAPYRDDALAAKWEIIRDVRRVVTGALELERLMLHGLAEQARIVRQAYVEFDYKSVVASLSAFMNSELSAFYFDIRKDTLYCDPPSSVARKAALTAIDMICDAIVKWLAPVLSFTCDEAWAMYRPQGTASVLLLTFPKDLEAFRED